jgi:hypothetical protein
LRLESFAAGVVRGWSRSRLESFAKPALAR